MAEFGIVEKLAPLIPSPSQQQQQSQEPQRPSSDAGSKKSGALAALVGVGSSEEEAEFLAVVHREPDLTNIILRLLFNLSFDLVLRRVGVVFRTLKTHFTMVNAENYRLHSAHKICLFLDQLTTGHMGGFRGSRGFVGGFS